MTVIGKRHNELSKRFKEPKLALLSVTAFPVRKIMGKSLGNISWENLSLDCRCA
ncbi:hypothetical protein KO505_03755 [Psychrosphaera sp. F3M07]|nr:hypothetical protein [Psychrosphaera sp. F3M07]